MVTSLGHDGNYTLNPQLLQLLNVVLTATFHSFKISFASGSLSSQRAMATRRIYIFRKIFYTGFSLSFILSTNENFHSLTHTNKEIISRYSWTDRHLNIQSFSIFRKNETQFDVIFFLSLEIGKKSTIEARKVEDNFFISFPEWMRKTEKLLNKAETLIWARN